jgi:hypothetical protein
MAFDQLRVTLSRPGRCRRRRYVLEPVPSVGKNGRVTLLDKQPFVTLCKPLGEQRSGVGLGCPLVSGPPSRVTSPSRTLELLCPVPRC